MASPTDFSAAIKEAPGNDFLQIQPIKQQPTSEIPAAVVRA